MFLFFRAKHCPICGVRGIKNGSYYRCLNCESIFSDFGVIYSPSDEFNLEPSEIFKDN